MFLIPVSLLLLSLGPVSTLAGLAGEPHWKEDILGGWSSGPERKITTGTPSSNPATNPAELRYNGLNHPLFGDLENINRKARPFEAANRDSDPTDDIGAGPPFSALKIPTEVTDNDVSRAINSPGGPPSDSIDRFTASRWVEDLIRDPASAQSAKEFSEGRPYKEAYLSTVGKDKVDDRVNIKDILEGIRTLTHPASTGCDFDKDQDYGVFVTYGTARISGSTIPGWRDVSNVDCKDIARAAAAQLDRYTTSSPNNEGKGEQQFTRITGVDIHFEKES